jgi:hypothetical protein
MFGASCLYTSGFRFSASVTSIQVCNDVSSAEVGVLPKVRFILRRVKKALTHSEIVVTIRINILHTKIFLAL